LLGALFGPGIVVRRVEPAGAPSAPGGRRLQGFGVPFGPPPPRDPLADVWMIGGVFLERYITIFDFDKAQIGFAEPKGGPVSLRPSASTLSEVLPASVAGGGPLGEEATLLHSGVACTIAAVGVLAALALAVVGLVQRARSTSFFAGSVDLEQATFLNADETADTCE